MKNFINYLEEVQGQAKLLEDPEDNKLLKFIIEYGYTFKKDLNLKNMNAMKNYLQKELKSQLLTPDAYHKRNPDLKKNFVDEATKQRLLKEIDKNWEQWIKDEKIQKIVDRYSKKERSGASPQERRSTADMKKKNKSFSYKDGYGNDIE